MNKNELTLYTQLLSEIKQCVRQSQQATATVPQPAALLKPPEILLANGMLKASFVFDHTKVAGIFQMPSVASLETSEMSKMFGDGTRSEPATLGAMRCYV